MDDWPALVREHGPLVWRVVHRLLSDYADASDAFQETFASALRASRQQPVENWPGLLHRLATICSLNRLRQRYRERARTEPLSNCDDVPALGSGPVEHAEAAELALGLRQALARLSS